MNNVSRMKVLSLAVLGLTGLALAGSAAAGTCPASPVPPWTAVNALSGGAATITAGGLDASACKLDASLGTSTASQASVTDTSPADETRYRFQFLVNADAVSTLSTTDSVVLFNAGAATGFPSGGSRRILQVGLVPAAGGARRLALVYACNNGTTYKCLATTPNLAAGVNRIEFDLQIGAAGSIRYWINAPAGTTEPPADGEIDNIDNQDWVGVSTAVLGLGAPAPTFSSSHAGEVVSFDTFDSRRQTYIGY